MIKDDFVVEYWNERSTSYSATVCEELNNEDYQAWFAVLENHLSCFSQSDKRALDLGCGPGFFSIILARLGFAVDAVDMSTQMLVRAATNVTNAGVADQILFHEEDAAHLPFPDNSFDAIVMRNVTWLMRDPAAAYAEWHRVLAPGGKLLIFDANWYRPKAPCRSTGQKCSDLDGRIARNARTRETVRTDRCFVALHLYRSPSMGSSYARSAWLRFGIH